MSMYVSFGSEPHLQTLEKLEASGRSARWTVNSSVRRGDTILFYLSRPVSSIVAVGHVESAQAIKGYLANYPDHYGALIKVDQFLRPALALTAARQLLPAWHWLRFPQKHVVVPPKFEATLREALRINGMDTAGASIDDPIVLPRGAGFGSPEENRKVEAAAVRAVRKLFKGWNIRDRQKDGCGYDLECKRKSEEEHVEVKGIKGAIVSFPITKKEYDLAASDPNFVLYAVTRALTQSANVHRFSGKEMRREFEFREIAYFAKLRRKGSRDSSC